MQRRSFMQLTGLSALAAWRPDAFGQTYPGKPVRIVVPWPAGGIADMRIRQIAEKLTPLLGQQVLADNRPGASGQLAAQVVADAPADGYTLLYASVQEQAIGPAVTMGLRYNAKSFAPITL